MKGKRFLTGIFAAVLGISMSAGAVLAAGSAGAQPTTAKSSGFVIAEMTSAASFQQIEQNYPAVADSLKQINANVSADAVTQGLNDLANNTDLPESLRDSCKEAAQKLEGKEPATNFFDLDRNSENVTKTADGKYLPRLEVPSLTTSTTGLVALHYSTVRNVMEVVDASDVDLANKEFNLTFQDLSPVMVLVDATTADGVTDMATTKSATVSTSGTTSSSEKSPKTEDMTGRWMGFAAAAVVLAGAAVYVLRRKKA